LFRRRQTLDAKGGSLKRSLGMAFATSSIPKAFPGYGLAFAETSGFEAATRP